MSDCDHMDLMSGCGYDNGKLWPYGFGVRLWPCKFDVRLLQYDLMSVDIWI